MPDLQSSLNNAGGITKALLDALNQIQNYAAACQVGADGKPSGTAIYMHMPMGYPVDPKMFASPWTPGGGDSSSSFTDQGTFAAPAAAAAPPTAVVSGGTGPAGSVYPPPQYKPDQPLEASIQNAKAFTSMLVDNMLEVTQKGVAAAWPDRKVIVEYHTILEGIQPNSEYPAGPQDVLDPRGRRPGPAVHQRQPGQSRRLYAAVRQLLQSHFRTVWATAVGLQAAALRLCDERSGRRPGVAHPGPPPTPTR